MPHPYFEASPEPRIFAHRGLVTPALEAAGIAENSLAALAAAEDAGARYLESDCHLTRDGVVVLFHDGDLRRIAGDPRTIASLDSRELAEIMADRGGLLTLEGALERFESARFNLDVKAAAAAEPAGRLIAPHAHRVLLTSFSDRSRIRALRAVSNARAEASSRVRIAQGSSAGAPLPATSPGRATLARLLLALASRSGRAASAAIRGVDALQIPENYGRLRVLTPRLIEVAHRSGVEVHVWTVNDPARMRALVEAGVDGIITDRADLALEAFA